MKVTGYKFSKRKNSTLQPKQGTELEVLLKESTSIHSPSFLLSSVDLGTFNYLKWDNRYYFITDQIQERSNLIRLNCEMDYLATYKENIRSTSAFVTYSTSSFNKWLPDTRVSINPQVVVKKSAEYNTFNTSPCYFISYASTSDTTAGIVYDINKVVKELNTDTALNTIFNNPSSALAKRLNNVNECIFNCLMFPIEPIYSEESTTLQLANYSTNIVLYKPRRNAGVKFDVTIPWNFNDFRNSSTYTDIVVLLPGVGFVNLAADNFIGRNSFSVDITFDGYTGELAYILDEKYRYIANISTPYRVNTSNGGSVVSLLSNTAATVTNAAAKNPIGTLESAFNTYINAFETKSGGLGSYGGVASWYATGSKVYLYCVSHDTNVSPSSMASLYGRPLNEVKTLSSLLGYVQTVDVSVSTGDDKANNAVNSMLNGGVYLE